MELTLYYITLLAVSLCTTWWVFKKVLHIAKLKNIVDNPGERKIQRIPVPVMGGITVFFGMTVAFAAASTIYDISGMFTMICLMIILLYVGTMDDIVGLSPGLRFFIEMIVVLLLIYTNDYSINDFHGLWGIYHVPDIVAIPLTVFASVGIINAINLIDGVNGLCSGYCIVTYLIFGLVFIFAGDVNCTSLAIISIGALIPFFFHNVFGKTSKMFFGDGGTLLMGIGMSFLVINALKTDSTLVACFPDNFGIVPFTLAILAIPVFDTIRVMVGRIARRTSPFSPDKTHLHHLLMDLHFSHVGTTCVEILANLFVIACWYLSYRLGASIDFQLYIVIFSAAMLTFAFYEYARFQERKQTKAYHMLISIGDKTHVGSRKWFGLLQRIMDRNIKTE
jgi:UDP-N-acetylmuramyl pentapeptide phosphotransferase/UDP-N-acetylglucosamine-1-phosphate transferase